MRRLPTTGFVAATAGLLLLLVGLWAPAASAQDPVGGAPGNTGGDDAGVPGAEQVVEAGNVDVVKVDGLLDPVMADFIVRSIDEATSSGATAVVLQVDGEGSVLGAEDLGEVVASVRDSLVPEGTYRQHSRAYGCKQDREGVSLRSVQFYVEQQGDRRAQGRDLGHGQVHEDDLAGQHMNAQVPVDARQ